MGVIHVVAEAAKLGFSNGHPDWCNLGQGQPEVGEMAGAPARILNCQLDPSDCAYGPVEGTDELRQAVADYANRLYRQGCASQYGPENVGVASGGRLALTRLMAALESGSIGYQLPDYTAYEDMLATHTSRLDPVPIWGREEDGFLVSAQQVAAAADTHGISSYLFSNPTNPTGQVLEGDALEELVQLARERSITLISDEFYSHFIYAPTGNGQPWGPGAGPVSAAPYVKDVERDPVLIFDGLTKNHRYPGWRVGWTLGPSAMIEAMTRTGSAIDGGPSRLAQRAALEALEPARADQETRALREVFSAKRNLMVERLKSMGVRFASEPSGTFYCWGNLSALPTPFNDGVGFFERALQHKVLTVPGEYFDVDPRKERRGESPYRQWMRFSFGPPMDNMVMGLDRLQAMLGRG
jgi:aspartate/methionine/tyrosine aminotransferase